MWMDGAKIRHEGWPLTEARSHKGKSSFRDPLSEIGQNEQNRVTTLKTAEGKPKG